MMNAKEKRQADPQIALPVVAAAIATLSGNFLLVIATSALVCLFLLAAYKSELSKSDYGRNVVIAFAYCVLVACLCKFSNQSLALSLSFLLAVVSATVTGQINRINLDAISIICFHMVLPIATLAFVK